MDEDLAPDGGWVPGGPALYAARMALALGARVDLVTRLTDGYDRSVLEGINVLAIPASESCRYANTYDARGDRTQRLLADGEPIDPRVVEPGADAYMVAPAYHELAAMPAVGGLRAVSLQGALRATNGHQRVIPHAEPIAQAEPFLAEGVLAFFSEEDTADAPGLARHIASRGAIALLTRGYRGATIFEGGHETHFDAIPAASVDPTGAGDCFATAFLVRMVETRNLVESCHFALAAGSLAVEGVGTEGIPSRAAVEGRLERVVA